VSDQTQTGAGSELETFAPSQSEAVAMVRPEAFPRFREIIKASEGREWTDEEFLELVWCLTPEGKAVLKEALSSPEPEKVAASEASKHRAAAPRPIRASKQPSEPDEITREREGSELDEHLSRV
jgi:hypothetical protein